MWKQQPRTRRIATKGKITRIMTTSSDVQDRDLGIRSRAGNPMPKRGASRWPSHHVLSLLICLSNWGSSEFATSWWLATKFAGGIPGQQPGLPFRLGTNPRIRLSCTHSPKKRKSGKPWGAVLWIWIWIRVQGTHARGYILERNARTRAAAQESGLVSAESRNRVQRVIGGN